MITLGNGAAQVANGRRLAARQLVMGTMGAIPCYVVRKQVEPNDPATPTQNGLSWSALAVSDQDDPNYGYEPLGHAYLLMDRFNSGVMLKNDSMADNDGHITTAQIEPVNMDLLDKRQQVMQIPDWTPQEGDVFALIISEDLIFWLQIIGITGQTFVGDAGRKYELANFNGFDEAKKVIDDMVANE